MFSQILDSVAQSQAQTKMCGERVYELTDGLVFLSLQVPSDPWTTLFQISLFTNDVTKAGQYEGTLQVSLSSYSLVTPVVMTFSVTILPPPIN